MDYDSSQPGTPSGGPLQAATPDRVNRRHDGARDSSIQDKISQFNNLGVSSQTRQLERKTADAALKRAMLGREEAETETRRQRDEINALRKAVEEGRERERKVGERLETVMEGYGRAKETHAHTQALWEKEIRRARKETFKTQSSSVKLQEELKSARASIKGLQEDVKREKERSKVREQEAFTARYELVGVQEQLEQAREAIKLVEQERDAHKAAAKNEEVARIAAEGRLPLPRSETPKKEPKSPKKKQITQTTLVPLKSAKEARVSLSTWEIKSSVASELEIEDLTMQVQWERQRADRAQEMIEFLQTECEMHCCPCSRAKRQSIRRASLHRTPESNDDIEEDPSHECEMHEAHEHIHEANEQDLDEIQDEEFTLEPTPIEEEPVKKPQPQPSAPVSRKEPRRSTIFCPQEGIFRTISEQEAEMLEARVKMASLQEAESRNPSRLMQELDQETDDELDGPIDRTFARTPSVDPPNFAQRTSLLSLLNAPTMGASDYAALEPQSTVTPGIRQVQGVSTIVVDEECVEDYEAEEEYVETHAAEVHVEEHHVREHLVEEAYVEEHFIEHHVPSQPSEEQYEADHHAPEHHRESYHGSDQPSRAGPESTRYSVTTTTTKVPIHDAMHRSTSSSLSSSEKLRTPSAGSNASFDLTDPAMTPTMTREQALAKIRERRGRARSATQGKAGTAMKGVSASASAPQIRATSGQKRAAEAERHARKRSRS